MREDFPKDLSFTLQFEGGYVNDPHDPGGPTNKGVTQRVYDGFRASKGLKTQTVKYITSGEVTEIYRDQYAAKIQYDQLPAGVDFTVFDAAVNSGPSRAIMWLQKALGTVRIDGVIGAATIKAVNEFGDHDVLIGRMVDARLAFCRSLKTWSRFGKGWSSRFAQVRKIAQAKATGSVGPTPKFTMGGQAKAFIESAKVPPSKWFGDATTGGGAVVVFMNQLTDQMGGLTWVPHMDRVLSITTAVGGVMVAAGFLYRYWQKQRTDKLNEALDIRPAMPAEVPAS